MKNRKHKTKPAGKAGQGNGQVAAPGRTVRVDVDLEAAACELRTARTGWRLYRDLVEAPKMPPALAAEWRRVYGSNPNSVDEYSCVLDFLAAEGSAR